MNTENEVTIMKKLALFFWVFFSTVFLFAESVSVKLSGGTGKATIVNPVEIVEKNGKKFAKIVWTSKNFDYVIVGGVKYLNENKGGNSTFTVEVKDFSKPLEIIADTIAMSRPHEIEYFLEFEK